MSKINGNGNKPDTGLYYFYGRRSSFKQEESLEQQYRDFEKYELPEGAIRMPPVGDTMSATKRSADDRVELQNLLRILQPGDHLVVWRLDRLGRKYIETLQTIEQIADKEVWLHSIMEFAGMPMAMDSLMAKSMARILMMGHEFYVENMKQQVQRSIDRRRENGMAYTAVPKRGKKRYKVRGPGGKEYAVDRWDHDELATYAKIFYEHQNGRSFDKIANELLEQGAYHRVGKRTFPWSKRRKGGKYKGRPNIDKLVRAYYQYRDWLEAEVLPGMKNDEDLATFGYRPKRQASLSEDVPAPAIDPDPRPASHQAEYPCTEDSNRKTDQT